MNFTPEESPRIEWLNYGKKKSNKKNKLICSNASWNGILFFCSDLNDIKI